MAKKKPDQPGKGDDKNKKKDKDLPEWLRTDDWLQITPQPPSKKLPETPSGRIPVGLPPSKHDDQNTDMIQLDDDSVGDIHVPPSTMLFSDPDDSVLLTDDLLSGPASSSNLKPSSSSSLRLPKVKADPPPAQPPTEPDLNADAEIDLGAMPGVENPAAAGPHTSSIRKRKPADGAEDVIGQPLTPADPASGWLGSGTKLGGPAADPNLPSIPSMGATGSTWAELDVPQAKAAPQPPAAPATPAAAEKNDSWHPSSGNVGVPSLANIDLPPDEGAAGGDVFSQANRPGLAPGALKPEPVKIARPKAEAPKAEERAKPGSEAATPSLQLPSLPNVPAEPQKGSWHPSSGNVALPSAGEIDLPPAVQTDVFAEAKKPGRAPEPTPAKPVLPPLKTPAKGPKKPAEPQWLDATNISIVPGGLIPTQADVKLPDLPPAEPPKPAAPPTKADLHAAAADRLEPSSADFELPELEAGESPSTPPVPKAGPAAKPAPAPDSGILSTDGAGKSEGSSADFELPPAEADESPSLPPQPRATPSVPAAKAPPPPTPAARVEPTAGFDPEGSSADFELPTDEPTESPSLPPQPRAVAPPAAKAPPPKFVRPEPDSGLQPTSSFKGEDSSADFELPPRDADAPEPSDIFSTARKPKPTTKGDSGLFTGAEAPDSSFFRDLPQQTDGESNLFADPDEPAPRSAAPPKQDTGRVSLTPPPSAVNVSPVLPGSKTDAVAFDPPPAGHDDSVGSHIEVLETSGVLDPGDLPPTSSTRLGVDPIIEDAATPDPEFADGADELEAELAQHVADDDAGRPDFNILHGQASDSNLLGDRTFIEANLAGGPHSSSVNLADPNALSHDPTADSAQASSIFNKPDSDQQRTGGGKIDLDSIPLMGSSDDGTMALHPADSAVVGGRLDDPADGLEASVFDVTMPKDETADSGMIDWSTDAAKVTDRLGDASNRQPTMERTLRTEIPEDEDDAAPPPPKPAARKAEPKRPVSRPEFNLDDERPAAGTKGRNGLLIGALSLLAGAGLGAGAMSFLGGSGDGPKANANAAADAQKQADDLQRQVKTLEATVADQTKTAKDLERLNGDLNAQLLGARNVEQTLKGERDTAVQQAALDKKKAADDVAAAMKKAADDVAAAKKAADADLTAAAKKAADAEAAAKALETDKAKLAAEVKKAADDAAALTAAVAAAKKDAEDKAKALADAKAAADSTAAKLKAADATLDPVLEKLKAAKLIDDKADRAAALAALPAAIKKANLVTGDGDAAKLAKELTDVRDQLLKQKAAADAAVKAAEDKLAAAKTTADKQLADAKAAAEKSMADLQKKVDAADAKAKEDVKAAVAAAKKEAEAELTKATAAAEANRLEAAKLADQAKADRAADAKAFDAKLAALRDEFEGKLAAVKSGAVVPLDTIVTGGAEKAAAVYDVGTSAYFAGRYADAETAFAAAAKADQTDARYWYFLGLSKFAQGKDAAADFKKGADWEARGKPGRRAVAAALEAVQGPARAALEAVRP